MICFRLACRNHSVLWEQSSGHPRAIGYTAMSSLESVPGLTRTVECLTFPNWLKSELMFLFALMFKIEVIAESPPTKFTGMRPTQRVSVGISASSDGSAAPPESESIGSPWRTQPHDAAHMQRRRKSHSQWQTHVLVAARVSAPIVGLPA